MTEAERKALWAELMRKAIAAVDRGDFAEYRRLTDQGDQLCGDLYVDWSPK